MQASHSILPPLLAVDPSIHQSVMRLFIQTMRAGDYLVAAYEALTALPRWQRNNGADFVFYESHPGFAAGQAAAPFRHEFRCAS